MTRDEPAAPPAGVTERVFELALPAVDTTISRIRHGVDAFLARRSVPDLRRQDIAIALTEAVTNTVVHAYRDGQSGDVAVRAELFEDDLALTIVDTGGGIRPRVDSPGLGAGLSLIAHFTSRLIIGPGDGGRGTRLEMRFGDIREPVPAEPEPAGRDNLLCGYLEALADSSNDRVQDTSALIAEARQARSKAKHLLEERMRRRDPPGPDDNA